MATPDRKTLEALRALVENLARNAATAGREAAYNNALNSIDAHLASASVEPEGEPTTYESDARGWALSDEHEAGTLAWKGGAIHVEPDGAIADNGIAVMTPDQADARADAYAQAARWARSRMGQTAPAGGRVAPVEESAQPAAHPSKTSPTDPRKILIDQPVPGLVDLEQRYGDAAFGVDALDRRRHATAIVNDPSPSPAPATPSEESNHAA